MSNLNYLALNGSVILNYDGKTVTVNKDDSRYGKVMLALRENRLEDVTTLLDVAVGIEADGLEVRDGQVYVGNKELEPVLAARLLEYMSEGLAVESLVLFARKLRENPSFNSRAMLFKFLENNGHPITEDGNFIAYRGVRADFTDCHSGKFDNSVGSVCEMNRSDVDENPNNTCSSGLHVACFEYANSFGSQLIEVEVDPADVVAVPTDYQGTKMRVCRFKVVAVSEKREELDQVVYGVDKGETTDEEGIITGSNDGYDIYWNRGVLLVDTLGYPTLHCVGVPSYEATNLLECSDVAEYVEDEIESYYEQI